MNLKKLIRNLIGNKISLIIIIVILAIIAVNGYKSIYNKELLKNTFAIESEKFVEENENPIFSLKKVILYSSAHADDVGEDDVSQRVNISQFTDIALYIDNTGRSTELTEENTINELFIDNIKITPMPDHQNRLFNVKNSSEFGKYTNLPNYEEDGILFNVIHNNQDRQNTLEANNFYTDCSNPIVLGYLNKDLLTNCRIGADNGTLVFDGTILKTAGVSLEDISAKISFTIHIKNNQNENFVCNVVIDDDFTIDREDGIYTGYLMKIFNNQGRQYDFLKVSK